MAKSKNNFLDILFPILLVNILFLIIVNYYSFKKIAEEPKINQLKNLVHVLPATSPPTTKDIVLENEDTVVTLNPQGGTIKKVVLKKYKTWDQLPLVLLDKQNSSMGMLLLTKNGVVNTKDYLFTVEKKDKNQVIFTYTLDAEKKQTIVYTYTLKEGYQLSYQVQVSGLSTMQNAQFVWYNQLQKLEKNTSLNRKYSYLQYYGQNKKLGYLNATTEKEPNTPIVWVSNHYRFFTKGIVAPPGSPFTQVKCMTNKAPKDDNTTLMETAMRLEVPLKTLQANKGIFTFYFGPNKYAPLQKVAPGFEKNLYLGYPIIKSVNKHIILPTVDFLNEYTNSYVWAMILFVILMKLLLLYFIYCSHITNIKKKALKPAVEAIKAKYPDEKDKQAAQMAETNLYTKMGIPQFSVTNFLMLLLQILFLGILPAMYFFMCSSFDFRQVPFLWVSDLSNCDDFIGLPFNMPFLGSHISLFALLMTLFFFLPRLYKQVQPIFSTSVQWVIDMFVIYFFFISNTYPAGFCLYRIVYNIVDIIPPLFFKYFIDEAIYIAQMKEKLKNTPVTIDERPRALVRLEKKRRKKKY